MSEQKTANEQFIRDRITSLRLQKNLSEYQLSLELGHSRGYINNISSGKTLPSMSEFLNICDYFHITPKEFFDIKDPYPMITHDMYFYYSNLKLKDKLMILDLTKRLLVREY